MIDIRKFMSVLSSQRPLFHSEADFQHAFAWEFHRRLPKASVRLELPLSTENKVLHLDFWAVEDDKAVAVELKYKTRTFSTLLGAEQFNLANHSAQDIGRYDFIKDIQRLERITSSRQNTLGYAVLLTNDSTYWTRARGNQTVDAAFRLEHGRILHGTLSWGQKASAGTMRGREQALTLHGRYTLQWEEYSQLSDGSSGTFHYLAVQVGGLAGHS